MPLALAPLPLAGKGQGEGEGKGGKGKGEGLGAGVKEWSIGLGSEGGAKARGKDLKFIIKILNKFSGLIKVKFKFYFNRL